MLVQLLIRNFALIEETVIPFYPGLTVLSGETGAGKSIVADAVSLVLGGKADKDVIRRGTDKAYVEGTFTVRDSLDARACLSEQALDGEDGVVVLSREISKTGRSVCRVNGILVNLSVLKDLAGTLMEIHGQHEHQFLMDEGRHLGFLDMLGGDSHAELLKTVQAAYFAYHEVKKALDAARADNEYRQERLERLNKQKKEIEKANLKVGEEETLTERRDMMRHAGKIDYALRTAVGALSESEGERAPALRGLSEAMGALRDAAVFGERLAALSKRMENVYYEAEDIAYQAEKELAALDMDGAELETIEARLDMIRRLEMKYGTDIEKILAHYQTVVDDIARYEGMDEQIDLMSKDMAKKKAAYADAARLLSDSRARLARATEKKIDAELSDLNMKGAKFYVDIARDDKKESADGMDNVRFLIAANVGEDAKPLSKTASGGELSRIMLAIKSVAAEKKMAPSMVFDEVDSGISGRTAQVVAEKMWRIARTRQAICVTHLQQIAAMASYHALVQKYEADGRTHTKVTYLDDEGRADEVARLLGETKKTGESGRLHAKALLSEAAAYRGSFPE